MITENYVTSKEEIDEIHSDSVAQDAADRTAATFVSNEPFKPLKLAELSEIYCALEQGKLRNRNEYDRSLYRLLAGCYWKHTVLNDKNSPYHAKEMADFKELVCKNEDGNEQEYGVIRLSKIIRLVIYKHDGQYAKTKISNYCAVIKHAKNNGHTPENFEEFVLSRNGLQKARLEYYEQRRKNKRGLTSDQKIEAAKRYASAVAVIDLQSDPIEKEAGSLDMGSQIVLIATKVSGGQIQINGVIKDASTIQAVFSSFYKDHKNEIEMSNGEQDGPNEM